MLEMIDKIDVSVPAEYISEVIPIRYAQADDIANALNSLGGSGGATVAVGSASTSPAHQRTCGQPRRRSGVWRNGRDTARRQPSSSAFGQPRTGLGTAANPNGTPSSVTRPFSSGCSTSSTARAAAAAGGKQEPIQIFGQAKIIADERSQLAARFCHAAGHGANQARHLATGRAARAGAH